jgi:hypothetical protein
VWLRQLEVQVHLEFVIPWEAHWNGPVLSTAPIHTMHTMDVRTNRIVEPG